VMAPTIATLAVAIRAAAAAEVAAIARVARAAREAAKVAATARVVLKEARAALKAVRVARAAVARAAARVVRVAVARAAARVVRAVAARVVRVAVARAAARVVRAATARVVASTAAIPAEAALSASPNNIAAKVAHFTEAKRSVRCQLRISFQPFAQPQLLPVGENLCQPFLYVFARPGLMFAVKVLSGRRSAQVVLVALSLLLNAGSSSSGEYYPERTGWDRFTGGQLNISTFAFRDTNRNGVYDMDDHPMAGIAFEVTGGGRIISRRTNKSGFGNFPMSVLDRDKDVINPGEYVFLAMIPNGWFLTTDNTRQRTVFDIVPGAPADMVSSIPLQPVGLAQELTITGRVPNSAEAASILIPAVQTTDQVRIRAISSAGERRALAVDQAGSFSFTVTPGNWTVVAEDSVGNVLGERQVEISTAPVLLSALVREETQPQDAQRSTPVNFDDLVSGGIKEIPFGYRDLNWHIG
jgi:hypothetical protein